MTDEKPEGKETEEQKVAVTAKKAVDDKAAEDKAVNEKEADSAPSSNSPIDDAKDVLKKITEQNKITADLLKRQEKLQAEAMLGGVTPAGKETTDNERKDAAARKLIEGSGFEDRIFPKKK